jgi:hypothetical protein
MVAYSITSSAVASSDCGMVPKGEKRPPYVIGVAMCGRERDRWVYERILRNVCRQPQQAARPSGLTYRRLPSTNDKCLLNSFLNVGNILLVA